MIPELKGFAVVFGVTHRLFPRALEGLTPEQAGARPGGANPILWIAAHVVAVRGRFVTAFGGRVDVPWSAEFPRGGSIESVKAWPTLEQVRAKWDEVHPAFMAALGTLTSERLAEKTKVPGLSDDWMGVVALAALHDSYHLGQLGAARRRHGLDSLVG